jgi:ABC-type sulfate transport system substrate-binding protein
VPRHEEASAAAEEYLKCLYTPGGPEIATQNDGRPRRDAAARRRAATLDQADRITFGGVSGGWRPARKAHVAAGVFDHVHVPLR